MRNCRSQLVFVALAVLLTGLPAAAQGPDEPVVANRLYDLGGRLEISLTPAMSIFDKYTRHIGTSLGLAYYFNDYIGLEIDAGYAFLHGDRKLLDEILRVGVDNIEGIERLPLTDMKYMTWWATGGISFSPLYGKISLSAELDFNFHFYIVAGAGVADYKYSELSWTGGPGVFEKIETSVGVKPTFYAGGGVRVHFPLGLSLKLEIRDQFYYDEYDAETLAEGGGTPTPKAITDFVHITLFRLSVGYAFF